MAHAVNIDFALCYRVKVLYDIFRKRAGDVLDFLIVRAVYQTALGERVRLHFCDFAVP